MRISRAFAVGVVALSALTNAIAQFTGPVPLAWRWAHQTAVSPSGAPVLDNGVVYVAVGNRVFGIDPATGNQKWRYPLVEPITGYFRSAPVVLGNTVVAAADNSYIYGINAVNGDAKWSHVSNAGITGQPVIVGKMVIFKQNDNTLMALNVEDGTPAWPAPYRIFNGLTGQMTAYGNNLIFLQQDNVMVSMSAVTQKFNWTQRFSNIMPDAVPVMMGSQIFVNTGGFVACLSADSGRVRWQSNSGDFLAFSPAVSTEGVFAVSRDGNGYLFDVNTGRSKWRKPVALGSVPAVAPSAADKMFIAPTAAGAILTISPVDGKIVWSFLVRPLAGTRFTAGPENRGGSSGGGGARGGGAGGAGGGAGGGVGGGATQRVVIPVAIPASGPAVLYGKSLMILIQDGSLLSFDPEQGVDTTAPSIKMLWPNSGDNVGQPPLEMLFQIDDAASGVNNSTLSIMIDGQPYDFEYGRDGLARLTISSFGKNKPLPNGRRVIKVTATDYMGNSRTEEFALHVDNNLPPTVRPGAGRPNNDGGRGGSGSGAGG